MTTKKFILYCFFLTSLMACAKNPVTGRREIVLISESQEIAMGQQSHEQVVQEYGVVDNAALQSYVQGIGRKLAAVSHRPNLDWHFTVVDSPVVNAFAIPGGYIYFTRGILAYLANEAELAGVLGHEIAHITEHHASRQEWMQKSSSVASAVLGVLADHTSIDFVYRTIAWLPLLGLAAALLPRHSHAHAVR